MAEMSSMQTGFRGFLFKEIIRVRAEPPFLCLRRGFVQQQKPLTAKGIDAIRHSPFTMPKESSSTLATGASALVVQLAQEIIGRY